MGLRERILNEADRVTDWSADPTGDTREWYLELIAPGETPHMRAEMATMSGCGLVVAGLWRAAGIEHRKLEAPYRIGTGVSRLISIAHEMKAWVPYEPGQLPQSADMVLVGDNGAGGIEHVFTVVHAIDENGIRLRSVDGGQRIGKHQVIRAKTRTWKGGKDYAKAANDPGGSNSAGRKIYGWINIEKLVPLVSDPYADS